MWKSNGTPQLLRCAVVLLAAAAAVGYGAGTVTGTASFSRQDLVLSRAEGYDVVELKGCPALTSPGEPRLPRVIQSLVIPAGAVSVSAELTAENWIDVPGNFQIAPAQPDVPLPMPGREFTRKNYPPDATVYASTEPYPADRIRLLNSGTMAGYRIANVELRPVRWVPATGRLQLATRLSYRLNYIERGIDALAPSIRQREVFGDAVRAFVANPGDIARFAPRIGRSSGPALLPTGHFEYVTISESPMDTVFQRLARWKTRKGMPDTVVRVSWISANYTGYDLQERIRNFIIDAYNNWGTVYVLLGGSGDYRATGQNIVPTRKCFYIKSGVGAYSDEDTIPCDLYYAGLNGTWDRNGNHVWGQLADSADLYGDVHVGRASVYNVAMAQNFVAKVLTYEKNPPTAYLRKMLLPTGILWSSYNERPMQDSIARMTPTGWLDAKLYERNSLLSQSRMIDSMNAGFGLGHWVGHGNENGIYYNGGSSPYMVCSNADALVNADKVGVAISIACFTGAWDEHAAQSGDCLAERLANRVGGGTVASVMCSRYGWGAYVAGHYVPGPSERLDTTFMANILEYNRYRAGQALTVAKAAWVPYADSLNQYDMQRWCIYELNLLGDPELPLWTDVPTALADSFGSPIYVGTQNFTVKVTAGGSPVAGARVTLSKGGEVYARETTLTSGIVTFVNINPTTPGYMYVTATARNRLPKEDSCQVIPGPNLDVQTVAILAPTGTVNQGTTIAPSATVRNNGTTTQTFSVKFAIQGGYVDSVTITNLGAGATTTATFANWTAGPPGSLATTCSTRLAGDMAPGNNKLTGTVFVQSLDAQTVAIIAPTGTVNQGTVMAPQATVRNNGNTAQTFTVKFDISDGYTNTQTVTSLGAGATTTITFGNWTASTLGALATKCSTRLTGDMTQSNDKATGTVFVQSLDAQTVSIVGPTGTVNQGTIIAPSATVRNNGNTTQTFTVKFTVGAGYADSVTITNLGAGATTTATFANWNAGPLGSLATSCSTRLAGDMTPGNNKVTGTVFVQSLDAQTVSIVGPTGTVNQGTVVAPQASVRNNGNTTQTFSVKFAIQGGYADSVTISNLGAGATMTATFANWTAGPLGSLATSCSTRLAGDMTPGNNKVTGTVFVQSLDVQTVSIVGPTGTVNQGTVVAPQASVRNNGNTTQTFTVKFTVGAGYADSVTITNLGAGATTTATFANWTAGPLGSLATTCSTRLAGDMAPGNNRLTGTVFVQSLDAQTVAIIAPTGTVNQGTIIAPSATVRNNGNTTQTFTVKFTIQGGYADSVTISNLGAGATTTATFANWTAGPLGSLATSCSTRLAGDMAPGNNRVTGTVFVQNLDAEVISIIAPSGVLDSGAVVTPEANVRNNGNVPATFDVRFDVGAYSDTQTVTGLAPGATQTVSFAAWTARQRSSQTTRCTTQLAGDVLAANDIRTGSVDVKVHDIGAVAIVAPTDTIAPGTVRPQATVQNCGTDREACTVSFLIDAPTPYLRTISLPAGLPFADTVIEFPGWMAEVGTFDARCSVGLAADQVRVNDVRAAPFVVKFGAGLGWSRVADVLPGGKSKNVKDGGALAYGKEGVGGQEEGGGGQGSGVGVSFLNPGTPGPQNSSFANDTGYVYAFKGNNRYEFYRYNTLSNVWVSRESIPAVNRNNKKKAVKKGSSLVMAGDGMLYATKGNNTLDWWQYSPGAGGSGSGVWVQKTDVPTGAKNCKEGVGSAAVQEGTDNYVYLLRGSGTFDFYRYNTATDAWDMTLPTAPGGASTKPYKNGSSITYDGGDTIYCLKGSYDEFAAYSISGKTWVTKDPLPLVAPPGTKKKKVKDGSQIASDGGRIVYALKGGNTNELWSYQADEPKWTVLPDMPSVVKRVKGGGALVYAASFDVLYAFRGNNTREFWTYNPGSTPGSRLNAGDRPKAAQGAAFRNAEFRLRIAPNPLTSSLNPAISYSLPVASHVSLKLYDISGKLVSTLASGYRAAGNYACRMPPAAGRLSAGVYMLKFRSEGYHATEKLVIE